MKGRGFAVSIVFTCLVAAAHAKESTVRTGAFDLDVPLNSVVTETQLAKFSEIYEADEVLPWYIFVPSLYDPANPPGVLVYISPTRSGKPPWDWLPVLERYNMIYISAHKAGNRVPVNRRMSNAVLGLTLVRSKYETDPQRAFVSGFSGGGRTSTLIVEFLPKIFTGALFIGGAYEWRGDKTGIAERLGKGAYVFLTGTRDHAKKETHRTYWQYRKAGVKNVKLMIVKDLGHNLPNGKDLDEALRFLTDPDSPTSR